MTTTEKPSDKRRALGRGLDSLLPSGPRVVTGAAAPAVAHVDPVEERGVLAENQAHTPSVDGVAQILLDEIEENPFQTRKMFAETALQELAESIRSSGVVQPIVVRPKPNGRYVLILGERRCRASKLAGKTTIPAIVRKVSDQQAAEMTIVENLQRQDLNCLEQAEGFVRLSRDFGLTQEQIGQRMGVSRESVANYMRLLKLPAAVQTYLSEGKLGFSEARILLQLPDAAAMVRTADKAIHDKMSVARLKDYVDALNTAMLEPAQPSKARWVDPNVREAQSELERSLGLRVRIADRNGKGKIVIEYGNIDDFDRVVEALKSKA